MDEGVLNTLRVAVRACAAQARRSAPFPGVAALRELRAFAEAIGRTVRVRPCELTSGPAAPAPAASGSSVDIAAEADRKRIARAQAAAAAAQLAQTVSGTAGAASPAVGALSAPPSFSIGQIPDDLAAVVESARAQERLPIRALGGRVRRLVGFSGAAHRGQARRRLTLCLSRRRFTAS